MLAFPFDFCGLGPFATNVFKKLATILNGMSLLKALVVL